MERRFGLFGAGNLGLSISAALSKAGVEFAGVYDVDTGKAHEASALLGCGVKEMLELASSSDILLLAVPDKEISRLSGEIEGNVNDNALLVHFSGSLGSEVLNHELRLSAHPAQSFPSPRLGDEVFSGVYFVLEGSNRAAEIFTPYLDRIGAKTVRLDAESKPIYHAMCVMASNLVLGVLRAAEGLGKPLELQDDAVREIILRLASETILNARKGQSLHSALSGPVPRGERDTIKSNLAALEAFPDEKIIYKLLSRKLVDLAKEKGLKEALEIEELLS